MKSQPGTQTASTASPEYHPGILKMKFIFNSSGGCAAYPMDLWEQPQMLVRSSDLARALSLITHRRLHSNGLCDQAA
jgi:hypothetical protein